MTKPKPVTKIIQFLRNNEEICSLFKYNLMTHDIEFTRKSNIDGWNQGKFLNDEDLIHLKYYIAIICDEEFDKSKIEEAECQIMALEERMDKLKEEYNEFVAN